MVAELSSLVGIAVSHCTFPPRRARLRSEAPNMFNHCASLVEAVGIEPSSDRLVSHDSVAIAPQGLDGETPLEPSESELRGPPRTRVPNLHRFDELLAHARLVWGALRVI